MEDTFNSVFNVSLVQVANPMVRSNAAGLLMDAFPLQNPDAGNEEIDLMLQKQFDIFEVKKTRGAHLR